MSVDEVLMRPGSGEVRLIDDVPAWLTKEIHDLIRFGAGCHVVITPTPVEPTLIGDAATLSAALYAGPALDRPGRTSIAFGGMSMWLDSDTETAFTQATGTPTNWVDAVLVNGLTRGTVSGGSNVATSFPAYGQSRRQILDAVASQGGWEYEVRPNGAINAGTSVFTTTPKVVITDRSEGPDGTYTGLIGGFADNNVTAWPITTKVIALGQGAGASIVTGSATKTPTLKDRAGNTPTLVKVVNAPAVPTTASANTIAAAINTAAAPSLAMQILTSYVRRARGGAKGAAGGGSDVEIIQRLLDKGQAEGVDMGATVNWENVLGLVADEVATGQRAAAAQTFAGTAIAGTGTRSSAGGGAAESQFVRRVIRPGDNVYVYDIESGLFDTANQIIYRGEVIFPMIKRVLSMTWPIERGFGVYVRSNAATPVYYDLTPYVAWEEPGATLEVGDRPAESFTSVVNRTNPLVETRVNQRFAPQVRARRTTNQAINSGVLTAITWDTEDYDAEAMLAAPASSFLIPYSGLWLITARIAMAATIANRFFVAVDPTSSLTGMPADLRAAGVNEDQLSITVHIPLFASDTFAVTVFQTSGAAVNLTSAWIQATFIGP